MITLRGKLTRTLVERKSPPEEPKAPNNNSGSITNVVQPESLGGANNITEGGSATIHTTTDDASTTTMNNAATGSTTITGTSAITQTDASSSSTDNNDNKGDQKKNLMEEWTWSGIWAFGDLSDDAEKQYNDEKKKREEEEKMLAEEEERRKIIEEAVQNNSSSIGGAGDDNGIKKLDQGVGSVEDNKNKDNNNTNDNATGESGGWIQKISSIFTGDGDTKKDDNAAAAKDTGNKDETTAETTAEAPQTKPQKKKPGRKKGWRKKTPEEQAAAEAKAEEEAAKEAAKPRPFAYKWLRSVNAHDVIVPSALVIMIKEGDDDDDDDKKNKNDDKGGVHGEGGDKKMDEGVSEKATDGGDISSGDKPDATAASSTAGDVVMTDAVEETSKEKDIDGDAIMGNAEGGNDPKPTLASSSSSATKPTKSSPRKEPSKAIKTYGQSPFTDASDTYPKACPNSGKWEGHFENVVPNSTGRGRPGRKKKPRDNRIREMFYLFFNATPPPNARGEFDDSDTTIKANEMLDEKSSTNVDDEKKKDEGRSSGEGTDNDKEKQLLPKSYIHVRGYGTNRFGTFEIVGSLNPETGVLQCQRMYVPVPTSNEIAKACGGTQREPTGRFLDLAIPGEDDEKRDRKSLGRKRKSTWKKLDTDYVIGPDGIPIMVPSADGKRRRRGTGDLTSIIKKKSRLSNESTGSNSKTPPAPTAGILKAPPQCRGDDGGALSIQVPGASGMKPSTSPRTTTSGSGKRGKKKKNKGGGQAQSAPASYKGSVAAAKVAPPPQSIIPAPTLPSSGDPILSRWRAAHYLYYQRVEMEPEGEGSSWATSAAATANPSSSGGGAESSSGTTGDINPDLVKINYVIYEGEMQDGVRHGRGICLYNNNTLYEGQFKKNFQHGSGKLMSADRKRVIYDGMWEKGKMHGLGTYYYYLEQGSRPPKQNGHYVGQFRQNLRNGMGVYTLPDGSIYDGEFRDNIQNGYGIFRWTDGSIYEGGWKDGKRHGTQGILVASDGFRYEGQWVNNSMEGRGVATYPKGQVYDGTWVAGKREGRGTIRFTNGAVCEYCT